ncbi:MAG: IS630 family transposase [Alphaproteobacteria bacterium]
MGASYSSDLRDRVVALVDGGQSRRAAARRFAVSESFAVKLVQRRAATGSTAPARQGRPPGSGRLSACLDFLIARVEAKPDISMPELAAVLAAERGVTAHPASLSRLLCRAGYTYKKSLLAAECARADIRDRRRVWIERRQPRMALEPHRLVFLDETAVTTRLTRLRGRAPKGQRLRASAPFGRWQTQTFIAGLRCWGLTAPWIVDGAMDRTAFDLYVETQLAPTLQPGDVVILDNLSVHNSPRAAQILKERGAWLLFLPQYSPDLNPIEQAFAKLKAHLRKTAARTYDALWKAVGDICNLVSTAECWNYFKHAGYASD